MLQGGPGSRLHEADRANEPAGLLDLESQAHNACGGEPPGSTIEHECQLKEAAYLQLIPSADSSNTQYHSEEPSSPLVPSRLVAALTREQLADISTAPLSGTSQDTYRSLRVRREVLPTYNL